MLASDRAPSTKQVYAGLMGRHVTPVIGHERLAQLRPTDTTRAARDGTAGESASTCRNAYAALRAALGDNHPSK